MTDTFDVASPGKQQRASYKFIGSSRHISALPIRVRWRHDVNSLYEMGA